MRIIAGQAKGHRLKTAKGLPARPTTQLVRGAIFSILETLTDDWHQVLDLYAGSGALGLEALSRGASWADFVERDPRCCTLIRQNLERTGFAARGRVYCCQVEKALNILDGKYNIVFMDPPYSEPNLNNLLDELATSPVLAAGSILVVPHAARSATKAAYSGLHLVKERRHGDTLISVYRKEGADC
ncbi:MAG TPA: 16S rRNA (guanine(966)-N(2))-methyltransferase RsmD [Dehalococcoidia bacterium]|nr:16S rRNA (guanine(966)-N(2))-methyltransferase RsmD [Dehalococcoidia bacterium]